MDTTNNKNDFNSKGKKQINMSSPVSYTNQSLSTQYSTKATKTYNPQIFSPQPFNPMSYSQIYTQQPFTPLNNSRPSTPNPQRSLNNSPFNVTKSDPGSFALHHSNSTSNLCINIKNSPNALYPPAYNSYSSKHQNKKAVHKVIQHTRKVVNDQNNEEVEVSTEVTQQLLKVNGLEREEASIYSLTTYTNNDKKKKKQTKSNLEIHSYLSDSSSGSDTITPNPKGKREYEINSNGGKIIIESIPSSSRSENNNSNDMTSSSQNYNISLNDAISSSNKIKHNSNNIKYDDNYTSINKNKNNIQNSKANFKRKDGVTVIDTSVPIYHRNHFNDHGIYICNNNNNFNEYDEEGHINLIISPSSEKSYRDEISPNSSCNSYPMFSTTYQNVGNMVDDSINPNKRCSKNIEDTSNYYLHNPNQTSSVNNIVFSHCDLSTNGSSNKYKENSKIMDSNVNNSSILYNKSNGCNRKTHKTTTTTTTTYEVIENYEDDENNDEINNDIEKYVHFNNLPYQYCKPTSFYNRALLPPASCNEVITDKDTLSQQINLRKKSWHTSFFESQGKASSSMFSIPRYQPEQHHGNSENNSYDSLEDRSCFHILYQFDKEDFIVRLGKALYLYGSPTFRTEATLRSVSKLLGIQGEFASFPTLILLSFSNYKTNETLNSENHLLLTPTGYNLGKLEEVVQITYELKMALKQIKCLRSNREKIENGEKKEMIETKEEKSKNDKSKKNDKKEKNEKEKRQTNNDSVIIEIEKSSSIDSKSQFSRKRTSKSASTINEDKEYENNAIDITAYSSIDDINNDDSFYLNNGNSGETLNNSDEVEFSDFELNSLGDDEGKYQDIDTSSEDDFDKLEKVALTAAINKLDYVIAKPPSFGSLFWQIASYIVAGFTASPILFGGTWLDGIVSGIAGLIVGLITFYEPSLFPAHGHLLELLASVGASATLRITQGLLPKYCINFTADILSATLYLLPGLNFTIGFIELASRNMISGTVRLMHSLVTSFMMGAGITIGDHITKFIDIPIIADTTHTCETLATPNMIWNFLMFPILGISLNMMFFANMSQFPIMVLTTAISYVFNLIGTKLDFPSELTIIISALAVGVISNIYAKLRNKLAIIPIIIGVLLLVPGSVGVKGSLAFLIDQNFETGIQFTVSMFTVSMWITIGVFLSNLIVFPFKNSEHMGLMTL